MGEQLGFAVASLRNGSRKQMQADVKAFVQQVEPHDVAFLFFAGPSLAVNGSNFLLPADFSAGHGQKAARGIEKKGVPLSHVLDSIKARNAATSIAIVDATRSGDVIAAEAADSSGTAFVAVAPSSQSIVALAANASNGTDDHSSSVAAPATYVRSLIAELATPGLEIATVLRRARGRFMSGSNSDAYVAWENCALTTAFVPNPEAACMDIARVATVDARTDATANAPEGSAREGSMAAIADNIKSAAVTSPTQVNLDTSADVARDAETDNSADGHADTITSVAPQNSASDSNKEPEVVASIAEVKVETDAPADAVPGVARGVATSTDVATDGNEGAAAAQGKGKGAKTSKASESPPEL